MSDKRIRILYLIGSLQLGGAQRHLLEVFRRINRAKFNPHLAILIQDGSLLAEIPKLKIPVYSLSIRNRLYHPATLFRILRFAGYLRREKIQIVHTYLFESDVVGLLAGIIAGVPVRITSRRSMLFLRNRFVEMFLSRILHFWCHRVVAVCEAVRREAIEKEHLPAWKITTIYNGVDSQKYFQAAPKCLDLLGQKKGKDVIGMIATLKPIKDIQMFLKALVILNRRRNYEVALIVGDGPLRASLEKEAEELGLGERVVFTGERRDVEGVIRLMDISVLCSKSEGLSNTILESMAAGKPVIATDVGGNREVVDDGVTGLLVPAGDAEAMAMAMAQILENKDKATTMGEAARKRIEDRFRIDDMVLKMEALYKDLLAHNRVSCP